MSQLLILRCGFVAPVKLLLPIWYYLLRPWSDVVTEHTLVKLVEEIWSDACVDITMWELSPKWIDRAKVVLSELLQF